MLDWSHAKTFLDRANAQFHADAAGLLVGTPIATQFGWRPVDALCVGDMVLTFDHGFRPIKQLRHVVLWEGREEDCPGALRPILIPEGLLDATANTVVLPEQGVMVESEAAMDHRGDPFAVLKARTTETHGLAKTVYGLERIAAVVLEFEDDEVIYGHTGLHYFMPKSFNLLELQFDGPSYKILNEAEATHVLNDIAAQQCR